MTGGYTGVPYGFLDSTELLRDGEGQWTYSGQLPSYRFALKGATVNNKVIVTGTCVSVCMIEVLYSQLHDWSLLRWRRAGLRAGQHLAV